jgi:ATP-dependent helicase/nuclease subunit B
MEGGLAAAEGRRSEAVTPWDGLVGSLPPELDILSESGPSVSANRLQALGSCPLRYFFRYILDIERVDEEPPQPGQWLTPADRGRVLHHLFHVYMHHLIKDGLTPDFERDQGRLEGILDGLLDDHEKTAPPPSIHVREHERANMAESARIFLREEELFTAEHEPLYAEASIGLPSTDMPTELDHPDPVVVALNGERRIRVRGRIDRIDRRKSDGQFVVTDYKSGGSRWYTQKDRFHEGRLVQHLLYILMVDARLKETLALPSQVAAFRFLFPTSSAQGEGVFLTREELTDRMDVLFSLCDLAESGCFTPTDQPDDCRWCDYTLICGDTSYQAKCIAGKLAGDEDPLEPLRKLRGYI